MCWPTLMATIYKQLFEEALFPQIKGTFPRIYTEKILFHGIIAMKTLPGSCEMHQTPLRLGFSNTAAWLNRNTYNNRICIWWI